MEAKDFFEIIQAKLNLCISLQHPLSRWRQVNMLCLPKDKVESLRPGIIRMVNQLDNELNLLRRILISRRMTKVAEESGMISDDQWGGRQGTQCIYLALHVVLLLNILHLSQTNGAVTDIDATACFDCMPPLLIYLA